MSVSVGDVLILYIEEFQKDKYFIILGENDEEFAFATFYINTDKNYKFIPNKEIESFHLNLKKSEYPFLKYDSWLNLTEIFPKSKEFIYAEFERDPACLKYTLKEEQLQFLRELVKLCPTLKGKIKKKYKFYNS